ncbi:MAG: tetratricopeptide repeat protein [Candidatus Aureabacteria bacterium]|nr:tetratricopeptide repeat protein [Candidatus Auribacterota bacterium]
MYKRISVILAVIFFSCSIIGFAEEKGKSSKELTAACWNSLQTKGYDDAITSADKCVKSFSKKALEQQASLTDFAPKDDASNYWALNDVATCLFIKGSSLKELGKKEEAKKAFEDIINNYNFAQCFDQKGFFWKVAEAATDELTELKQGVNFGNQKSETFAKNAWEALGASEYKKVDIYVNKCIKMYGKKAKKQQASLKEFPSKEKTFDYWALNDVGTCLYIKAKSLLKQDKQEAAKKVFKKIIDEFGYTQCWDPQGWFWKVAEASQDQILIVDAGIDFGDYTSETLAGKAWQALGSGDNDAAIVYARKCIQLYRKKAAEDQAKLDGYAPKEKAFDYWALNDVGSCFFIMGDAYVLKKDSKKALEAYKKLVEEFSYAQCWDPKGWFWKPAVAARGKINKIAAEAGLMY